MPIIRDYKLAWSLVAEIADIAFLFTEQGFRVLLFLVHKKSPDGGCRRGKMSVDKVLNFAAEGFDEADNHIDLGFAYVILYLLIKLNHTQRNTGSVT